MGERHDRTMVKAFANHRRLSIPPHESEIMMRLRTFMLAAALGAAVIAQDDELVPAPYLADRYTAPVDASSGVLASGAEPGDVVTGRVLSGAHPIAGASLFVFRQTARANTLAVCRATMPS
jgi:hypothetical protein